MNKNVVLFLLGFLILAVCVEGLDRNTLGFLEGCITSVIGIALSTYAVRHLETYEEENNYGDE